MSTIRKLLASDNYVGPAALVRSWMLQLTIAITLTSPMLFEIRGFLENSSKAIDVLVSFTFVEIAHKRGLCLSMIAM